VSTVHEHAREIRVAYGYRDFDGPLAEELTLFVYSRAWTHGDGLTVLFEHATAWLRRERVLLPGVSVLARLARRHRDVTPIQIGASSELSACGLDPDFDPHIGTAQRPVAGLSCSATTKTPGRMALVAENVLRSQLAAWTISTSILRVR
jgi:hypothetical protein